MPHQPSHPTVPPLTAPGGLEIPDWVPSGVRSTITSLWETFAALPPDVRDTLPFVPRFRRLVGDPRMKRVWDELQRKSKVRGGYENQAMGGADESADDAQARAMTLLFIWIAGYTATEPRTQTERAFADEKQKLCNAVAQLREAADTVFLFAPWHGQAVKNVAAALSAEIDDRYATGTGMTPTTLIVERERSDSEVQAFVFLAADTCRSFFGRNLLSTVAHLANVSLDRTDMTRCRVKVLISGR